MAQQVTIEGSNLIDSLTQNTNNHMDSVDVSKFDAIYNKSLNTDNNKLTKIISMDEKSINTNKDLTSKIDYELGNNECCQNIETENESVDKSIEIESCLNTDFEDKISNFSQDIDTEQQNELETVEEDILLENVIQTSAQELIQSMVMFTEEEQKIEQTEISDFNDDKINIDTEINLDNKSDLSTLPVDIINYNVPSEKQISSKIADNTLLQNNVTKVTVQDDIQIDISIDDIKTDKNLISQQLIDELNVKIENASSVNTIKTESLTNSVEEIIKYNVENSSKNLKTVENEVNNIEVNDNVKITDSEEIIITENTKDIILKQKQQSDDSVQSNTNKSDTDVDIESETVSKNLNEDTDNSNEEHLYDDSKSNLNKKVKSEHTKIDKIEEYSNDSHTTIVSDKNNISEVIKDNSINKIHDVKISNTLNNFNTSTQNNTNISKENILTQIHNKIQMMNSTNNSKINMILNPESLGKVSIQLTSTKGTMTAEMVVSSDAVKNILEENISGLKDTLLAQGVNINNITVKISEPENNSQMDYTEQENSNSNKNGQGQKKQNNEDKKRNIFEELFSINMDKEENKNV